MFTGLKQSELFVSCEQSIVGQTHVKERPENNQIDWEFSKSSNDEVTHLN